MELKVGLFADEADTYIDGARPAPNPIREVLRRVVVVKQIVSEQSGYEDQAEDPALWMIDDCLSILLALDEGASGRIPDSPEAARRRIRLITVLRGCEPDSKDLDAQHDLFEESMHGLLTAAERAATPCQAQSAAERAATPCQAQSAGEHVGENL